MSPTDRELLELAAKAAGLHISWGHQESGPYLRPEHANVRQGLWNPLADDGDALRLATCLGLTIGSGWESSYVDLCSGEVLQLMPRGCQHEVKWCDHDGDRDAACRVAIVLAAAEIGSVMP